MSKKLVSLVLVLLMVFSAAVTLAEGSEIVLTDMAGREITLAEPATRIVVTLPAECEILCALGCEDTIVGRGKNVDYPASILDVPVVQSGADMNSEEIMALEAQVVLVNTMSLNDEQIKLLEDNGVTVVESSTSDFASVYASITMIGKLMGKEEEAQAMIDDMLATFDDIRAKSEGFNKSVYFEISPLQWGLWSCGSSSYMTELAEICGLKNIFDDQVDAWMMVSEEQVIERNPDFIVMISGMGAEGVEEILSREGWGDINAVKNQKVFDDADSIVARPGPRLKDAAIQLFDFIHDIAEEEEVPAA